jgi:hypothetical protein
VFGMGSDGSPAWLLVLGAGFVGLILSPIAEILIVKCIPRLGALPTLPIRITTAALTALVCAAFSLRLGMSFALPAFIFLGILGIQLARIDISLHLLPNPLSISPPCGRPNFVSNARGIDKQADNLLRAAARSRHFVSWLPYFRTNFPKGHRNGRREACRARRPLSGVPRLEPTALRGTPRIRPERPNYSRDPQPKSRNKADRSGLMAPLCWALPGYRSSSSCRRLAAFSRLPLSSSNALIQVVTPCTLRYLSEYCPTFLSTYFWTFEKVEYHYALLRLRGMTISS